MAFNPNDKTLKLLDKFYQLRKAIDNSFFFATMGGVAVDGYAGKITRDHPDIDLIIFRNDLEKAELVLDKLGYKYKRFTHPKEPKFVYKMQTGDEDHLFSFQIADLVGENEFEISFYRDPNLVFPLSFLNRRLIWI